MPEKRIFHYGAWFKIIASQINPPNYAKLSGIRAVHFIKSLNGKRIMMVKQKTNGVYFGWKVFKKASLVA